MNRFSACDAQKFSSSPIAISIIGIIYDRRRKYQATSKIATRAPQNCLSIDARDLEGGGIRWKNIAA